MGKTTSHNIIIAGAGIAGLTAALAFARRGHDVRVFEQADNFETVGAGIQLSPNATRILNRLSVLDLLLPQATHPPAVLLKDASTLRLLARVPLGEMAEERWGGPYLVVHRADLQAALLQAVSRESSIRIATGMRAVGARFNGADAAVSVQSGEAASQEHGDLIVGADGVWSALRVLCGESETRFSGEVAWRTTIDAESEAGIAFGALTSTDCVNTFLHSGFHLVAYPVKAGAAFNLVAFTPGESIGMNWAGSADPSMLAHAMRGTDKALRELVEKAGRWTVWPVHTVEAKRPWIRSGRLALIGDAAHAMTPFAAQGAAMAIEDADMLAALVTASDGDMLIALSKWERVRRPRVAKVAQRGSLNRLAWHAAGPMAFARNLFLMARSPEKLASDLDWLYGYDAKRIANSD